MNKQQREQTGSEIRSHGGEIVADTMLRMFKFGALCVLLGVAIAGAAPGIELPSKQYLSFAAIKAMAAAAEAEAEKRHVQVTICVVDESGNLLFLEKEDGATLSTLQWAQKKARHAAFYGSPSKNAADTVKAGNLAALAYPEFFPNQGGLPIKIGGRTIGGIAASGASSEIDEAIAQAGLDALAK